MMKPKVWPSGSARTIASVPINPDAPARFSITTGWPSASDSGWAIMRATMSVVPAGGHGTIIRMGLVGAQVAPCANPAQGAARAPAAAASSKSRLAFNSTSSSVR